MTMMRQSAISHRILLLLAAIVILAALAADLPAATADDPGGQPAGQPAIGDIDDDRQFRYLSLGRTDPFRPFISFTQIERPIPTENPASPLESYAINQFKLVGILLGPQNYAMIEDPEQISYTVREGDRLGNLSGTILSIQDNGLVVSEPYLDIYDRQQVRNVTLKLHSDDDSGGN
ncbi:MAG: pilus assembly protein PilP [Deltaproteobacteria bacterium]|nr:pilus assembly protein PilP [Candidatus Anaeroferrophillacea bacterium]